MQGIDVKRTLTRAQHDVFWLFGLGYTPREVAELLDRSVKTIESHQQNIKDRLGLDNVNQLVHVATRYTETHGRMKPK